MVLSVIAAYYDRLPEPEKGLALALRKIILESDPHIREMWKYSMPFFYFRHKMFCYLWKDKKTKMPYLGMVQGHKLNFNELVSDGRKRIKILPLKVDEDLPLQLIRSILKEGLKVNEN